MESKTVVITGIKGQIASYAADKFLSEGYKVVGTYKRCSIQNFCNIEHIIGNQNFTIVESDICDAPSTSSILEQYKPWALLNFAAQSHVGSSYTQPIVTAEIDYIGVANLLECIRHSSPTTRFWNANTSERYGDNSYGIQNEDTPPTPISPYAVAKVAAEYLIKAYRKTYGMHASFSIMFNSESPRRSKEFVTRKITDYVGKILWPVIVGEKFPQPYKYVPKLKLGNLEAKRSWTHCKDTVDGIFKQVSLDIPDDFVFGREETRSIKEFLAEAFGCIGIENWSDYVEISQNFIRPSDVQRLCPSTEKARKLLGWEPKISFKDLVREMVDSDIGV